MYMVQRETIPLKEETMPFCNSSADKLFWTGKYFSSHFFFFWGGFEVDSMGEKNGSKRSHQ